MRLTLYQARLIIAASKPDGARWKDMYQAYYDDPDDTDKWMDHMRIGNCIASLGGSPDTTRAHRYRIVNDALVRTGPPRHRVWRAKPEATKAAIKLLCEYRPHGTIAVNEHCFVRCPAYKAGICTGGYPRGTHPYDNE